MRHNQILTHSPSSTYVVSLLCTTHRENASPFQQPDSSLVPYSGEELSSRFSYSMLKMRSVVKCIVFSSHAISVSPHTKTADSKKKADFGFGHSGALGRCWKRLEALRK